MFSLIISIISIALVAALAAATVYFGGSAFNKGGAGADASTFVNAGQQISGAFTLAETDGVIGGGAEQVNSVADLTPDYLAQQPSYKGSLFVLDATDTTYVKQVVPANVCEEVNKRANGVDASGNVVAVTAVEGLYGCVTDSTTAFYKVTNTPMPADVAAPAPAA